jgi:hypothetical protein
VNRRQKLVVLGGLVFAVVAAGAAIGATKVLTPREESQAVIDDAARQLGVQPAELSKALKQALKNRVDAAVADGRLTKAQAARLKERIDANSVPLFGFRPPDNFGHRGHEFPFHSKFDAAAEYLGITSRELRQALENGKTLAQIAKDRDKSVDGLVAAMLQEAKSRLERAVKAGRLTEAEKAEMLAGLEERITDLVNGRFPGPRMGPPMLGPRFHRGERIFIRPAF